MKLLKGIFILLIIIADILSRLDPVSENELVARRNIRNVINMVDASLLPIIPADE